MKAERNQFELSQPMGTIKSIMPLYRRREKEGGKQCGDNSGVAEQINVNEAGCKIKVGARARSQAIPLLIQDCCVIGFS